MMEQPASINQACPGKVDAIQPIGNDFRGRFMVILEDCIDCGLCVPVCPVDCIHDARSEGVVAGKGGYTRIKELQAWAKNIQIS